MVSTKHCCWGECKTDSRYPDKWPNSLKELQQSGKKVFIPFPKPSQDIEKCKRWLVACSRQFFTEEKISRNTYICALHWPGGKGPTAETPDPLKANLTPQQATRACAPKRKAPKPRREPVTKKEKLEAENDEILELLSRKPRMMEFLNLLSRKPMKATSHNIMPIRKHCYGKASFGSRVSD